MKSIGIIAEYNPFHNGHLYQIEHIKEIYPDSLIVIILNGYFLERGLISLETKKEKTRLALKYGADLVIELPFIFGSNSADTFADASIKLANALNIDTLVLYKYGLYVNSIAASIKGIDKKQLAYKYDDLPIKELNEIKITGDEIMSLLHMKPCKYLKEIFKDLEKSILLGELTNDNDKIKEYLINNYGTII